MRLEDRVYLILSASYCIALVMLTLVVILGAISDVYPGLISSLLDWWWAL